jgi:spore coat protein U-like protein
MKIIKIKNSVFKTALSLVTIYVFSLNVSSAYAGTNTASTKATASISSSCLVSATNMSFGNISPSQSGSQSATASVTTQCTKGTTYTIGLNEGSSGYIQNNSTWSYLGYIRTMTTSGGSQLLYNIFKDSAHTQLFGGPTAWGQSAAQGGQGTAVMVTKTGTGLPDVTNMYGIMSSNQFVTPGTYSDTIPVVVNF